MLQDILFAAGVAAIPSIITPEMLNPADNVVIFGGQYSPTVGSGASAFDSDLGAGWFVTSGPMSSAWVGLCYPVPVTVKKTRIVLVGNNNLYGYIIEYSDDGVNWTIAVNVGGLNLNRTTHNMAFTQRTAKYWRFRITDPSNNLGQEIGDLKFLYN